MGEVEKAKPSQVLLPRYGCLPFIATFDRAEYELAAALYVEWCKGEGDEWKPIGVGDVGRVIRRLREDQNSWYAKYPPFIMPDFRGLVAKGWFRFTGDKDSSPVEPVDAFFERIEKWVKRE